jgi:hypothetical protein
MVGKPRKVLLHGGTQPKVSWEEAENAASYAVSWSVGGAPFNSISVTAVAGQGQYQLDAANSFPAGTLRVGDVLGAMVQSVGGSGEQSAWESSRPATIVVE